MERDEIEVSIRLAFADVHLGSGVSLRQAQVIDNYGRTAGSASYLETLPRLVDLWDKDAAAVAASMDQYWAQFLPQP